MDETAHGGGSDQSEQPQDEHDNGNGIEHDSILSVKDFKITSAPAILAAKQTKNCNTELIFPLPQYPLCAQAHT
jgi:hypothetical protein